MNSGLTRCALATWACLDSAMGALSGLDQVESDSCEMGSTATTAGLPLLKFMAAQSFWHILSPPLFSNGLIIVCFFSLAISYRVQCA